MLRLLLISFLIISGVGVQAQSGEETFAKSCIACHTIGSGDRVGPDLKGLEQRRTMEWIEQFILSSEKLINSGDKDAIENFEKFNKIRMQDFDFNPTELSDLITYIIKAGGGELPQPVIEEIELTPEEKMLLIPMGAKLFEGAQRFAEGGVSCFACHHVTYSEMKQGGSLGADLTGSFAKYNGFAGLKGFIATPSSMLMEAEYSKHPLTKEEITSIVAFLEDANGNGTPEFESTGLMAGGIIVACLMIFIIMAVWSEKKRDGINQDIRDRQKTVEIS